VSRFVPHKLTDNQKLLMTDYKKEKYTGNNLIKKNFGNFVAPPTFLGLPPYKKNTEKIFGSIFSKAAL